MKLKQVTFLTIVAGALLSASLTTAKPIEIHGRLIMHEPSYEGYTNPSRTILIVKTDTKDNFANVVAQIQTALDQKASDKRTSYSLIKAELLDKAGSTINLLDPKLSNQILSNYNLNIITGDAIVPWGGEDNFEAQELG